MKTHQINETHLGTDATPDQARALAERLTKLGFPSEYNSTQGISSALIDPETGAKTEIPDDVWFAALRETETVEDAEPTVTTYRVIRNDGRDVLRTAFATREEAEAAIRDIEEPERHPFTYSVREVTE